MLILSRRKNESLVIGKDIEITVLEISGSSIKIGITAPKKVKVLRKELIEEVSNINKDSQVNINEIDFKNLIKNLKKG